MPFQKQINAFFQNGINYLREEKKKEEKEF